MREVQLRTRYKDHFKEVVQNQVLQVCLIKRLERFLKLLMKIPNIDLWAPPDLRLCKIASSCGHTFML
jgi:hypothetical protein